MNRSSLLRLALKDPRESPRRNWPLFLGLVIGLATWLVLAGLTRGTTQWVRERVGGSLPNRIRVTSAKTQFGPLQLGGGISPELLQACRDLPGVQQVFRQAHYPGPCQLFAHYGGESLSTDLILEGVDPGQVADQLPNPAAFVDNPRSSEVPAVIPRAVLDVLNAGISAHTRLPNLSEQALVGRSFQLRVGSSSFAPGPSIEIKCRIVGVSDQLGISGPALPLAWVERHAPRPVEVHSLTLDLDPGADLHQVLRGVEKLGLTAPDLETARKIGQASLFVQALAATFALAILLVAAVGIGSGFLVKVQLEQQDIGLYRSLGATRKDIAAIYLVRALVLGLQGAVLGLIGGGMVGLLLSRLISSFLPPALQDNFLFFQPGLWNLAVALVFGPLVAVAAAWLPARQAAQLEPGKILRG